MQLQGLAYDRNDFVEMGRFERFQTRDLEEARSWGTRVFCENNLRSLDARKPVNARMYYRRMNGIGIGRMSYGGEVTIEPGVLDSFYLIQMPLCGSERIECAGETTQTAAGTGSILNAHRPVRIRHADRTEKLILRVDRDLLERHCRQHLGGNLPNRIEFDTAMPLETGAGQRWMRTIHWLLETLKSEPDPVSPLLSAQIEQMVVTMLLVCQTHNYTRALCEDSRTVAPAFIRRTEQFIEEHAHEPITVGDMAEHVGVSTRSLFTGFRKYRNTSPMLFLKEVRLSRVREQLLRGQTGRTTVTAVAYQWGFGHLGHFTTDYKRRFGESPSETLAR
ncbi:AraC family transcriptional regulator [Azoarcus sp. L1K30]|uniref:AraC family transcriptional regulator n=1 Tax=Azoarcus sp. L1K30 TaxID=2820277 RepID=UPI001B845410|nr:AraC family transcriptional regulator [Azoarcus sp. L1K30]MBR0568966.1 AraC family transcriptional regulator [Azoarcus sp. L1K30]